jgi:hypothetical protein
MGDIIEIGDSREFEIINDNDAEGSLTLSLRRMQVCLQSRAPPRNQPYFAGPHDKPC